MTALHSQIVSARRIVVKVGSSSVSGANLHQVEPLVAALAKLHGAGIGVVLVSSGAIANGLPLLNLSSRPTDLATQQAAAAVGQNALMVRYQQSFDRFRITTGQVLLTASDIQNETSKSNAKRAMQRLLSLDVIPIVNENDTVATQEIRFGDNDRLAALVAKLVNSDVLILLSDVDALYDMPPERKGAKRISQVAYGDPMTDIEVGSIGSSGVGTGGAVTKVSAARYASEAGIPVLLTSTNLFDKAITGEPVGTWFEANTVTSEPNPESIESIS